jgi:cell division protein FtsQ
MAKKESRRSVSAPREIPREPEPGIARVRARRLARALRLVFGALFLLGLTTAVAFGARHLATTSDRFALEHLVVSGSTRFSESELCKLLGIQPGDNLFAVDLARAEHRLAEHPWVASVKLRRKLPSTLELELVEYHAKAVALLGDQLYLVTEKGHPIVPFDLDEHGDYPIISGVTVDELSADRARALERVARGISILELYERSSLARNYEAQELNLAVDGSIELVVGDRGVTLVFGQGPVEQKLLMAARVLGKVRAQGELPKVVFLDNEAHPERVVVRLR